MEKLPSSFNHMYLYLIDSTHYLSEAIDNSDRINIIRSCSDIISCASDILEELLSDDVTITIK